MRPARTPDPAHDAWPSYVAIAAVGYVVYGVGAVTPYLRSQLGLSDAIVGLHSSALALGLILSGMLAAALDRRFGEAQVRAGAIIGLVAAIGALAVAPALIVTLAAALLVGLGAGTLLGYANAAFGRPGGRLAHLRVVRANVWAMVSAFVCPVMLSAAALAGLPWGLGLAPALVLLSIVGLDLRAGGSVAEASEGSATGRLPRAYWLVWAFLVAAIAVEFSIVFWGATLV
ncbi:MAG: hypothetical protein QOC97_1040, partial [Chloroflexota bacterium]|nr:hypothetical protein [Chloroflexota bacterium]